MTEREEDIVIDEEGNTEQKNITHATILFNMMYEHITEYMTYRKI